jgi:hypothetical protein
MLIESCGKREMHRAARFANAITEYYRNSTKEFLHECHVSLRSKYAERCSRLARDRKIARLLL